MNSSSNILTRHDQVEFFDHQIKAMQHDFRLYLSRDISLNADRKEIYLGKIIGYDGKRGNLLIQFKKGAIPRLNQPYLGSVFSGIKNKDNIYDWNFATEYFYKAFEKYSSELFSVYSQPSNFDNNHVVLGFRDVETTFLEVILPLIEQKKTLSILIGRNPPPEAYLQNLKAYITSSSDDYLLDLPLKNDIKNWKPEVLPTSESASVVIDKLLLEQKLIIQGPPGTGKSYLISQVVSQLVNKGMKVCIASLTNKALIEVVLKDELAKLCKSGVVYKTNLKANEAIEVNGLKGAKNLLISGGELLLSTFYTLSSLVSELKPNQPCYYDVIIIEEASQAFLPTISAFNYCAQKLLIVGDPMQMSPIVLEECNLYEKNYLFKQYAAGLVAVAANTNTASYLLNSTYRLNKKCSEQTGVFYGNQLISKQKVSQTLSIPNNYKMFFDDYGGSLICSKFNLDNKVDLDKAISLSVNIIRELQAENPESKLSILLPYKKDVINTQEVAYSALPNMKNIIIETIDRIQGMTVDYCIVLLPLRQPNFSMNLERINVATSRSKNGTLIFINDKYKYFNSTSSLVKKYLSSLKVINMQVNYYHQSKKPSIHGNIM